MQEKFVLELLRTLATKYSGDRRTKVAAGTYVDGILEYGVNHLEYTLPEEDIAARTSRFYATMVHAEVDLCDKLRGRLRGKTVYVTLFPCDSCARRLIAEGVVRIVAAEDRPTAPYIIAAKQLLDAAGVDWEVSR